jgi:hypothetical protein
MQCSNSVAEDGCPYYQKIFEISADLPKLCKMSPNEGTTLFEQIKMQTNSVVCGAFLMDGSTDITDTVQLVEFVHGIHSTFEVHKGVASLRRLKGFTTGEDLFLRKRKHFLLQN